MCLCVCRVSDDKIDGKKLFGVRPSACVAGVRALIRQVHGCQLSSAVFRFFPSAGGVFVCVLLDDRNGPRRGEHVRILCTVKRACERARVSMSHCVDRRTAHNYHYQNDKINAHKMCIISIVTRSVRSTEYVFEHIFQRDCTRKHVKTWCVSPV